MAIAATTRGKLQSILNEPDVQAETGSGGTGSAGSSDPMSNQGLAQQTQANAAQSVDQINGNMNNVLGYQQAIKSAMASGQMAMAVDAKCWSLLDQVIQSIKS